MESSNKGGLLVISLDFELLWGVRDKRTIENYGDAIIKVHHIVPQLLSLFRTYDIRATFATVGFLMARSKEELLTFSPKIKPNYKHKQLSPYSNDFEEVKDRAEEDPYHFAPALIDQIKAFPEHEIGTHTFSHFYCLEEGQTVAEFEADLKAAISIARERGIEIKSLVFPRNQYAPEYLEISKKYGIIAFRGNERVWFKKGHNEENTSLRKRIFRTLDCYINISGHHTYELSDLCLSQPCNILSSRFLRPYSSRLPWLEKLKIRRIKSSMTHAAKRGRLFHLWWHPHNFGRNTEDNMESLKEIFEHFRYLNSRYNFESGTMSEAATRSGKIS